MQACVLLSAFLSLPILAETVIGTVERVDADQIQIKTRKATVVIHADERTTVRKGDISNHLSALSIGDEVRATCYGEGVLTAANISAKVTFSGVISEASSAHIKVVPDVAADVAATFKSSGMFVFIGPGLRNAKDGLQVGQKVHVIGWDSGNGVVDADTITIRNAARRFRAT